MSRTAHAKKTRVRGMGYAVNASPIIGMIKVSRLAYDG
jgi:hypothetical protein